MRLRPIVATRRRLLVANGPELVGAGFPLLPTLDDANTVDADLVVVCWISHGPRIDDATFDPAPGDPVALGDDEEAPLQGRVVRRDGDQVTVRVVLADSSAVA